MRSVVQRVTKASVSVGGKVIGKIGRGLLILLGVCDSDTEKDVQYMADKIAGLRIFEDKDGKMNLSVADVGGELLAVSQFTLYGDCRKGKRPNFSAAGKAEHANELYEKFAEALRERGFRTQTGKFGADMQVELVNDGPVTILIDSQKIF